MTENIEAETKNTDTLVETPAVMAKGTDNTMFMGFADKFNERDIFDEVANLEIFDMVNVVGQGATKKASNIVSVDTGGYNLRARISALASSNRRKAPAKKKKNQGKV